MIPRGCGGDSPRGTTSVQTHHQAGVIRAPFDWHDDRAGFFGIFHRRTASMYDRGDGDIELMAEVSARVARQRIGYLAHEIAQVVVAHVSFLHAHQHDAQHALRGGKEDHAVALATDLDHTRVIGDIRYTADRQMWRTALGNLLHTRIEVVQHTINEHIYFGFGFHLWFSRTLACAMPR